MICDLRGVARVRRGRREFVEIGPRYDEGARRKIEKQEQENLPSAGQAVFLQGNRFFGEAAKRTFMESFAIGVDLGGTNLRIAAVTPEGERLETISLRTRLEAGPAAVLDDMAAAIAEIAGKQSGEPVGIGVGSPGPLELPAGVLHHPPNLPGFDGLHLRDELERRVGWAVHVDSDGNLAAYGEALLGAGRAFGLESLMMYTLGTGVGSGIVLEGRIWRGMQGAAGESGHGPLAPDGPVCGCGARGCLEMYASATAIVRRAKDLGLGESGAPLTSSGVAKLAEQGDARGLQVFDEAGRALGLSLAHAINALDLPLYVIGGGAAAAWTLFAPRMFATVREGSYVYRMSMPRAPEVFEKGKTHIAPARLGSEAGILGAALLPMREAGLG
ncbi:MAG TPA: ROK family protein [Acidobacteriaceae bacterium]|jgi:glucokinase|nr:ROK family protein [Acidobacteriaceae bacterium]